MKRAYSRFTELSMSPWDTIVFFPRLVKAQRNRVRQSSISSCTPFS